MSEEENRKKKKMTKCSELENNHSITVDGRKDSLIRTCHTCGHHIKCQEQVLYLSFANKHLSLLLLFFFLC
jgi:hypothetical protein